MPSLIIFLSISDIYFSRPSEYCDRQHFETSTGNLGRHIKDCDPQNTAPTQQITAFASGTTYSSPWFWFLLSMWCARRHRPFKIVADPKLVEIFQMLYHRAKVPHPVTVSRDVKEIFRLSKENVANILQVSSCLSFFLRFQCLMHSSAIPGQATHWHWWLDFSQHLLLSWHYCSPRSWWGCSNFYSRFCQVGQFIKLFEIFSDPWN